MSDDLNIVASRNSIFGNVTNGTPAVAAWPWPATQVAASSPAR